MQTTVERLTTMRQSGSLNAYLTARSFFFWSYLTFQHSRKKKQIIGLLVFQIEGDAGAVASKMASELIARIDTDGNGTLDEEEFLTVRPLLLLLPSTSTSTKIS